VNCIEDIFFVFFEIILESILLLLWIRCIFLSKHIFSFFTFLENIFFTSLKILEKYYVSENMLLLLEIVSNEFHRNICLFFYCMRPGSAKRDRLRFLSKKFKEYDSFIYFFNCLRHIHPDFRKAYFHFCEFNRCIFLSKHIFSFFTFLENIFFMSQKNMISFFGFYFLLFCQPGSAKRDRLWFL